MIQDLVEIVLAYFQYLSSILDTPGVAYPYPWLSVRPFLGFIELSAPVISNILAFAADSRLYFMFISLIVPLILVFAGLLALNPKKVVLWYFLLLASLIALLTGVLATVIAETIGIDIEFTTSLFLMGGGGGVFVICILSALINKFLLSDEIQEELSSSLSLKERFELDTRDFQCGSFLQGLLQSALFSAVGIAIFFFVNFLIQFSTFVFQSAITAIAAVLIIIGVMLFLWNLLQVTQRGRRLRWHAGEFMEANFMKLLLLLTSILYIPIGSSTVAIFNCNPFTCPAGRRMAIQGTLVSYNQTEIGAYSTASVAVAQSTLYAPFCVNCNLYNASSQLCSASWRTQVCGLSNELRLETDPIVSCERMQQFFWPAGGVAMVILLGVPFMFARLIQQSTTMLYNDFPVHRTITEFEEIWERKVVDSSAVTKFLFQSFEFKYRYWRLAQILQKIAIVVTSTYIVKVPSFTSASFSLICGAAVHSLMSIALFITEPFIRLYDDGTSTALGLCLVTACAVALMIIYGVVPPNEVMIALIAIYIVIPVALFFVGVGLELRSSERSQSDRDDERRQRVVDAMERISDAEMRTQLLEMKVKREEKTKQHQKHDAIMGRQGEGGEGDGTPDEDQPAEQPSERPMTTTRLALSSRGGPGTRQGGRTEIPMVAGSPRNPLRGGGNGGGQTGSVGTKVGSSSSAIAIVDEDPFANQRGGTATGLRRKETFGGLNMQSGGGSGNSGGGGADPAAERGAKPPVLTKGNASPKSKKKTKKDPAGSASSTTDPDVVFGGSFRGGASPLNPFSPNNSSRRQLSSVNLGGSMRDASSVSNDTGITGGGGGGSNGDVLATSTDSLGRKQHTADVFDLDHAPPVVASPRSMSQRKPRRTTTDEDKEDEDEDAFAGAPDPKDILDSDSDHGDDGIQPDDETEAFKKAIAERRERLLQHVLKAEETLKAREASSVVQDEDDPLTRSGRRRSSVASLSLRRRSSAAAVLTDGGPPTGSTDSAPSSDGSGSTSVTTTVVGPTDAALSEEEKEVLQLAEETLLYVTMQIEEEEAFLKEEQANVDNKINSNARTMLNRSLMLAGFFCFVALGLSILGLLAGQQSVVGHSIGGSKTISEQLSGQLSFEAFSKKCCCVAQNNSWDAANLNIVVESWFCEKGRTVERVRELWLDPYVANATATYELSRRRVNGFAIRPLCGMTFVSGCSVEVSRKNEAELKCDANITATADEMRLW